MNMNNRPDCAKDLHDALGAEIRYSDDFDKNDRPFGVTPDYPADLITDKVDSAIEKAERSVHCKSCLEGAFGECALLSSGIPTSAVFVKITSSNPAEIRRTMKALEGEGEFPFASEEKRRQPSSTDYFKFIRDNIKAGADPEELAEIGYPEAREIAASL